MKRVSMKKLTTKLEFEFGEQEEIPVIDVDMKLKSLKPRRIPGNILISSRRKKMKRIDVSTKLF
jgi:hypothetical protein